MSEGIAIKNEGAPEIFARKGHGKKQSLKEHSANVAKIMRKLLTVCETPCFGELGGNIHDGGKSTPKFQNRLDDKSIKANHAKLGAIAGVSVVEDLLRKLDVDTETDKAMAHVLSQGEYGHHSGLDDTHAESGYCKKFCSENKVEKSKASIKLIEDWLRKNSGVDNVLVGEAAKEFKRFVDKIKNRAKFLFTNGKKKDETILKLRALYESYCVGLYTRFFSGCLVRADRTDAAVFDGVASPLESLLSASASGLTTPDWDAMLRKLESHVKSRGDDFESIGKNKKRLEVLKWRRKIFEICGKVTENEPSSERNSPLLLRAATGSGKTFSGTRAALEIARTTGKKRVVYFSPYLSITTQTAEEIRKVFGSDAIMEYHSMAEVPGNDDEKEQSGKTDSNSVFAFDSNPMTVTTFVRFLDALCRPGASDTARFSSLAESVLVFDEVQSLPPKFYYLFYWAVDFLSNFAGTRVVMMTATPPTGRSSNTTETKNNVETNEKNAWMPKNMREIIPSEGDFGTEAMFTALSRSRICYREKSMSAGDVARHMESRVADGKSGLAILNTTEKARKVFRILRRRQGKHGVANIYHLSARLPRGVIAIMLGKIRKNLENGEKTIVVSTSLIEAGVDISFSFAFRELTGMPSILQAAGRVNRHGESDSPGVVYVAPVDSNSAVSSSPLPFHEKELTGNVFKGTLCAGLCAGTEERANIARDEFRHVDASFQRLSDAWFERRNLVDAFTDILRYQYEEKKGKKDISKNMLDELAAGIKDSDDGKGIRLYNHGFRSMGKYYTPFDEFKTIQVFCTVACDSALGEERAEKMLEEYKTSGIVTREMQPWMVSIPEGTAKKMEDAGILTLIETQEDGGDETEGVFEYRDKNEYDEECGVYTPGKNEDEEIEMESADAEDAVCAA